MKEEINTFFKYLGYFGIAIGVIGIILLTLKILGAI